VRGPRRLPSCERSNYEMDLDFPVSQRLRRCNLDQRTSTSRAQVDTALSPEAAASNSYSVSLKRTITRLLSLSSGGSGGRPMLDPILFRAAKIQTS